MLLPTSLVGSYPQPEWLIDRKKLAGRFPPRVRATELWRIPAEFLAEAQDDATLMAIKAQEEAGLDIITDGEIRRESYSNRFATALEGVDIDNPGTALDRSGHPNPVPRIVGKIRRKHAVEVEDLKFLKRAHRRAWSRSPCPARSPWRSRRRTTSTRRRRGGDGLRRRGERGDPRPLRRRRRHRADRRALHAGAAREGARVRPRRRSTGRSTASPARPRCTSASATPRSSTRGRQRLFVPGRTEGLLVPPGLDRDRAVEPRLVGARPNSRARRSSSA